MPLNHKIFLAQFDAIKKIAEEGPCVLVGRCADYALEERDDVLSVFIHADLEDRIKNVAKLNELTDNKAKDLIHKTDKRRASYYNYYTNNSAFWQCIILKNRTKQTFYIDDVFPFFSFVFPLWIMWIT